MRPNVDDSERSASNGLASSASSALISTERTEVSVYKSTSSSERRKTENFVACLQCLNSLEVSEVQEMKIDEEEGSGSKIVRRMVSTKLKLETSEHTLFKRM